MKKFYFALLAMIIAATAFSADAATVYFKNTVSWETVKVHYWGSSNTDWPGNAGTLVEGTTDVWSFNLPEGTTGLVFNNNGAGEQTVDVTEIVDGHIYTPTGANKYGVTHTEYTPGEQPEQPVEETAKVYFVGDLMGDWTPNEAKQLKLDKETGLYTLTIANANLETGKEFKVVVNGKWLRAEADQIAVNTEYVLSERNGNMTLAEAITGNVTITYNAEDGKFKISVQSEEPVQPEETVEKIFTVFFDNTANWEKVNVWIWENSGANLFANWPGEEVTTKVNVDGNDLYAYSFKHDVTSKTQMMIIFNDGNAQTGDFSLVNKGIYTNEGHTGNIHEGAAVAVSSLSEGIVVAQGNISGETTEKTFKLTVTALPHHTAHYVVIPESAASLAPAREGAEYTAVENVEIELPTGAGTIQFYSHDGEKFSQPTTYSYNIALDTTGIEGVEVENGAAAEYFNLQGVRVANPTEGLYIVRRGNTVTKQYIR